MVKQVPNYRVRLSHQISHIRKSFFDVELIQFKKKRKENVNENPLKMLDTNEIHDG